MSGRLHFSITLQGWTECEVFEASGKAYVPAQPVAAKAAAAASGRARAKRVEFYYSSAQKPGEMFPCDIKRALQLVKDLQGAGVDCKAVDVAGVKDRFPIYHKTVSGPDATVRPCLRRQRRTGGGLWNHCLPAPLVFEGDRYPVMAFPAERCQARYDPRGAGSGGSGRRKYRAGGPHPGNKGGAPI